MNGIRFLICSDSHGAVSPLLRLVQDTGPDCLLFLGDGIRDVRTVLAAHPSLPALCVAGNNDAYGDAPAERTAFLCGRRVFMAHGHAYGVKRGLWRLFIASRLARADIVLFGHTHTPRCSYEQGMLVVNPGSVFMCPDRSRTYALLSIDEASGRVDAGIHTLDI